MVRGSRFKVPGSMFKVRSWLKVDQGSRHPVQGPMLKIDARFRVDVLRVDAEGSRFQVDGSGAKIEACIDKVIHDNM